MSVHWLTLWMRPPPVKICVSVRWVTLWVRPSPPVKICVSVHWVTMWVRPPLCVSSFGNTVVASPPLLCVCSLGNIRRRPSKEDDLWWKRTFSGKQLSVDPCMLPTPHFFNIETKSHNLTFSLKSIKIQHYGCYKSQGIKKLRCWSLYEVIEVILLFV